MLTTIAYNGRHYNTDVIYLTQDVVKATTAMRRNADNFIMLTTTGMPSLEHVYKEYASIDFPTFADFQAVQMKVTENYGELVIDNTDPNLRGKERFKRYRGKPIEELPLFEMCCPAAWGVRTAAERSRVAAEQRKRLPKVKKYERSYMQKLKNRTDTEFSRAQLTGRTQNQQRAAERTPQGLLTKLATRYGQQ